MPTLTKADMATDLACLGDPPARDALKADVQARWEEWRAAIDAFTNVFPEPDPVEEEGPADDSTRAVPDPTEGFADLLPATVDVGVGAAQLPEPSKWQQLTAMAEVLADSRLVPPALYRRPADVTLVLLTAHDLGIPSTMAFSKVHVIDSKPTMASELMVALVLREGHRLWPRDVTETSATACGQRKGSPEVVEFTFTMADAERAGLPGKARGSKQRGTYDNYPKAMLWARAVSGLARMVFPDVLCGVSYTPEELGAVVDVNDEGEVIVIDDEGAQVVASRPDDQLATDEDRAGISTLIGQLDDGERATLLERWKDAQQQRTLHALASLRASEVDAAVQLVRDVAPRLFDDSSGEDVDVPDAEWEPAAPVETDDQRRDRLRAEGKCISCGQAYTDNTRSTSDPDYHQSCEPF